MLTRRRGEYDPYCFNDEEHAIVEIVRWCFNSEFAKYKSWEISQYDLGQDVHKKSRCFEVVEGKPDNLFCTLSFRTRRTCRVYLTMSSEAIFSYCSRVLNDRRMSLKSNMMEMLALAKGWDQAELQSQETTKNFKLLTEYFKILYINDPSMSSGPYANVITSFSAIKMRFF